jgi:MFS family permease
MNFDIMKPKEQSIWTKDFLLHCFSYLLIATSFYILLPTLPVFVVKGLNGSQSSVGYIIGIFAISALIFRPLAGMALDKYGRKNVYLGSLSIYTILLFLYPLASSFFILLSLRFLQGATWGAITSGGSTITADVVPKHKRGVGIGFFGLAMPISMALGPIIGLYIMGQNQYNRLFYVNMGITLLAFLIATKIKYPEVGLTQVQKFSFNSLFEKRVGHISLSMIFASIPFAAIMTFTSLHGEAIGISNSGYFFMAYAIGVAVSRPVAGRLMDTRGPELIMLFSFTMSILGLVILGFSTSLLPFLISGIITGLGNGVILPTIQTMIMNIVEPERRGVANSTFFSSIDLGISIGSVMLGYIATWTSLSQMFVFCGILLIFPMMYFYLIVMKDYYKSVHKLDALTTNTNNYINLK